MAWVSGVAGDGHLGQSLKAALSPAMGHGGSETTLKCSAGNGHPAGALTTLDRRPLQPQVPRGERLPPLLFLLTQIKPTMWNSAYRLPALCLLSSHSSSLNRKNALLITAPEAKAAEPASWHAPISFRKDLSPRAETAPCHLPWGFPPGPQSLCLPREQNFSPPPLRVSPGLL